MIGAVICFFMAAINAVCLAAGVGGPLNVGALIFALGCGLACLAVSA